MNTNLKRFFVAGLLVVMLSLFSGVASASCSSNCGTFANGKIRVDKLNVEVNDVDLDTTDTKELEKTDELDVLVVLKLNSTVEDIQVVAELTGYDKSDRQKISDDTDNFDVIAGTVYDERLELQLPVRFEQGSYALKVRIETREFTFTQLYPVFINAEAHQLEIRDIVLSPENDVKAGRALLTSVRVKNRGEEKEEDVKVKVSIPALGISASDFIDELDEEDCSGTDCDDSTTSEEIFLRIPDCAEPGEYTVRVSVDFDDGDEEVVRTTKINVVEGDLCGAKAGTSGDYPGKGSGKTIITIGPENQDINQGSSGTYPLTISNEGSSSRTYSVNVDAPWADVQVTPSNVLVVGAGESKAVFIAVSPESGASGSQVLSVSVTSGDKVLKQVPLKANVRGAGGSIGSVKKAVEVGIVVLVVLLVILALIIAFNKMKGDDEGDDKGEESYY